MRTLARGEDFGRYRILEELGVGGMGRVYLAEDTVLHRRVAVKVLLPSTPGGGTDGQAAARMLREARTVAALDHPNAVGVYDVGTLDDLPFLAMEYVKGRTLASFVKEGGATVATRLLWVVGVGRALAAAHHRGIVHRDVKPANVMVREDGVVKVLDFGIARQIEPRDGSLSEEERLVSAPTITREGVVVGTPLYMAPEQLLSGAVDGRTDQFAWGVLAYELFAGRVPWRSEDGPTLAGDILGADPAPPPEVSSAVAKVILRALEKSPAKRFSSMDDALTALEAATKLEVTGEATPAPGAEPKVERSPGPEVPPAPLNEPGPSGKGRSPVVAEPSSRSRRTLALAGASVALVAIVTGTWRSVRTERAPARSAPSASAPSAAVSAPVPFGDLRPPEGMTREVALLFTSAMQDFHDGSLERARHARREALRLDPSLAALHVREMLFGNDGPQRRAHLASATQLRASLSPRDQAVLQAFEPWIVEEKRDHAGLEARLQSVARDRPDDTELLYALAMAQAFAGHVDAALETLDHAVAVDPTFAAAWLKRGKILWTDGSEWAASGAAFTRCLEAAPSAQSCLREGARVAGETGDCETMEARARRLVAIEPKSSEGHELLGQAVAARGAAREAVESVMQKSWALAPADRRAEMERADVVVYAALRGDFRRVEAEAIAWERSVERDPAESAHSGPLISLIEVYREGGNDGDAARVADRYLRRLPAWQVDGSGALPHALVAAHRGGLLSKKTLEYERDRAIARWQLRLPSHAKWGAIWDFHGPTAFDEAAAREALAALAPFEPLPTSSVPTFGLAWLGRIRLLAGAADAALPLLRRAAASCFALESPFDLTRANLHLGQALEKAGDTAGACVAYHAVDARWGAATRRSITAETAKSRLAALRCGAR